MTVVEDPSHDDIISMLRRIREMGHAARVEVDEGEGGYILITAATDRYGRGKNQTVVGHYRVHDLRSGAMICHRAHEDVFGVCMALQQGFEIITDPESLFD